MKLRINIAHNRQMTIINVYALTMSYPEEESEVFYQQLREFLAEVKTADKLILPGDFNARVGADHNT